MATVSKDFIVKNGIIVSNTITSTDITTTSAGGGSLYLNGSNNRIDFNNSGVSAPTFTTISTGTKIVLYPNVGAAAVDFALGIESGTMWSSVPTSANQFKWYAGTTSVASLSGTGTFSTTNISYTGTLTGSTGILNIGSGQLYKDASGNVGIGTSSPATTLDVVGSTLRLRNGLTATEFYDIGRDGVDGYLKFNGAQTSYVGYKFFNTGSEVMRIDSSGNVGIGTSSPAKNPTAGRIYLTLQGSTTAQGGVLQLGAFTAGSANNGNIEWFDVGNTSSSILRNAYITSGSTGVTSNNLGSQIAFGTKEDGVASGGIERMRIDSSGNVGIGTATPAQKLSVAGVIESTTGGVKFPDGTTQTSALSDNIYTVTGITGTAATITVDFSLVYSNAIIITLPTGTTSATINFININSKATSGMLFAFSIILSHVTALTATTSVVWRFGAAATSGSLPKWTGNIVPPSTVAANAIDIWSFFSYDVGTSLVGSLSMADIRNA